MSIRKKIHPTLFSGIEIHFIVFIGWMNVLRSKCIIVVTVSTMHTWNKFFYIPSLFSQVIQILKVLFIFQKRQIKISNLKLAFSSFIQVSLYFSDKRGFCWNDETLRFWLSVDFLLILNICLSFNILQLEFKPIERVFNSLYFKVSIPNFWMFWKWFNQKFQNFLIPYFLTELLFARTYIKKVVSNFV